MPSVWLVTFILPSGVAKLHRIAPDTSGDAWTATDRGAVSGIFGIAGTLAAEDFAYTTGQNFKAAIADFESRAHHDPELRLSAVGANNDIVPIKMTLIT